MARITLKEYAIRLAKDPAVARQRAIRGAFSTAYKFGRDWTIDEDEPWIDRRIKLLPAHAGVILWTALATISAEPSPRVRGGDPESSSRSLHAVGSPRARGGNIYCI